MDEIAAHHVRIDDLFWSGRQQTNAQAAIAHQWDRLEASGCIDNFRIAAGDKQGFREGWFFADSDAYKWLDAAARVYALWPSTALKERMDGFLALLERAQLPDGYLYTYNQLHFPGERWGNLLIEHELYCLGHLIEAGVSHFEATGETTALKIVRRAADLLVRDFRSAGPAMTDGHEEIEIALLRLYQACGQQDYLELARLLLERRGRAKPFAPLLLAQNGRVEARKKVVVSQRRAYVASHPEHAAFELPPGNYAKSPPNSRLRWVLNALSGKYFQMHTPLRRLKIPVGHAVRFGYLETAAAMLARLSGDRSCLPAMQQTWQRMVTRRMYVTGGLGSVPGLEGFGNDDELDPEYAYAETCAALACMFWNWELALLTGEPAYSDLLEWQLYNASGVGMGLDGTSYLYNNPLACRGGVTRRPWFAVPCCPSNLSRTWASLGKYVFSSDDTNLWVHQYIGCQVAVGAREWRLRLESGLPWEGRVRLSVEAPQVANFTLHLRIPSWAGKFTLRLNGDPLAAALPAPARLPGPAISGYDPRLARFLSIPRSWSPGDVIELDFDLPVTVRRADRRLRRQRGQVALTRGPLVYCLESPDNPGLDLFALRLKPDSLRVESAPDLLGGIRVLCGETVDGRPVTAIPYMLWANRGESQMVVWIKA
jgi:DUF1680 family protein